MTFLELKNNLRAYVNRDDITPLIGNWITLAQKNIERTRNWKCMQNRTSLASSDDTIAMPTRYKSIEWLLVKDGDMYYPLVKNTPQEIFLAYPDPNAMKGRPNRYASMYSTNEFMVRPYPDKEYTFDIFSYNYLAELATDTDTNWWTLNAWDLLLYGALLIAARYIGDEKQIQAWTPLYQTEISNLVSTEINEDWNGTHLTIGFPKPPAFDIDNC